MVSVLLRPQLARAGERDEILRLDLLPDKGEMETILLNLWLVSYLILKNNSELILFVVWYIV